MPCRHVRRRDDVLCYNNARSKTPRRFCASVPRRAARASMPVQRTFHACAQGRGIADELDPAGREACARKGLQLTPLRQAVLGDPRRKPCPARRLCDHRGAVAPRGQGDRAADRLPHARLLPRARLPAQDREPQRLCALRAFRPCAPGRAAVCEKCGRSDEVEDLALVRALRDTADRAGFQAHRQMVELVGVCRDCSAAGGVNRRQNASRPPTSASVPASTGRSTRSGTREAK